jgi:hypothetical protein
LRCGEADIGLDVLTDEGSGAAGSVSIGFMHATPGEIKSFRSSAERIALMVVGGRPWRGTRRRGGEVTFCNAMRRLGKRPEGLNATGHSYAIRAAEKRQTEESTRGNAAMSCQARRSPEADNCATALTILSISVHYKVYRNY